MNKKQNTSLQKHSIGMIGLLAVQYLIGTLVGMYVEFPEDATAHEYWKFAMGNGLVMAHIIVGTLVVLGAVALYVRAIKLKDRNWKIAGGLATGSSLLSWVCGEEFITNQSDVYSFAMAVFFILALLSFGWGVYKSQQ